MGYNVYDYDFEYDDDILVSDESNCFDYRPVWHHSNFDHIEHNRVVDSHGFIWDYAIPYYEHLKGKEMEESDLCL